MTSIDISSVRDFTKTRLRRILIDFYYLSIYSFGPIDENLIDLNTNNRKLIELTNKNLFKNFNANQCYNIAKQAFEKPNAFIYIKILNSNKFTKKLGDYLIELSVFKKQNINQPKNENCDLKIKNLDKQKSITILHSSGNLSKFLKQSKSLNDFKRLKVNPTIFKSKTIPKDQVKVTRFGLDKIKFLERKIRYGFQRRNYSDIQTQKNLKEAFQHHNPAIINKTSNILLNVPPNWNYCNAYELDLNKILNPLDLILKIDIRLLEFIDINPMQSKIVKMLSLKDLLTDQFLDIVIIKDLKKFYFEMIESIKNQIKAQQINLDNLMITNNLSINSALNDKSINHDLNERNGFKSISASDEKISFNLKKLKIIKKPKKNNFLFRILRRTKLNSENNNPKQNDLFDDKLTYKLEVTDSSSSDHKLTSTFKTTTEIKKEIDGKNNDQKIIDNKLNLLKAKTDSSVKSVNRKCPNLIPFKLLNLFKNQNLKFKKSSKTIKIDNGIKRRKRKFENTAFLSVELQLGTKIESSKEKRLLKFLNHIDMFTVLALEGRKSYVNFKELKNQSSWRFIYTPFHIFLLNQNKIHSTINALEDAICRTIAIAKIYAKYSRIKNFCHLNSSINDLLYQYSLNSKQIWFTELSQLLEDYLFENLEQIFKAEMPASLMTIYKYNYSKYGEFLFDNQIQLILGVIAIKSSLQSDLNIQIEDIENVFINQESDDETLKDKNKKSKKNNIINKNETSTGSISEFTFIGKEKRLISSQQFSNTGLSLLGSMAKGFERCTKVWMQYMESKKPESNLEELVHFSRALKNFCIGLVRVFQRQQYLLVKKILTQQKKTNPNDDDTNLDQIVKQYLTTPILPRFVLQSLVNLHLIIDSHIFSWIPFSLRLLIDKLILPVDYDDATDVAKRNAIFQASPYKDIYNSLRVTIEKLQSLHNEPIQLQVTVQTIQGWFPLNVTQAWISEEIQRVECECATWDEFFKELAFIRSDSKIDKMEKLTDKEKQIKEKEFVEFINDWIIKKLDDIVVTSINEVNQLIDKNDLISSTKFNYFTKTASEIAKDEDLKNKSALNESTTSIIKESIDSNENRINLPIKLNDNSIKDQINEEKFKEPADKIKYELDKLIKSQSITSQLADKLIIDDNRKEKTVQNVLEAMKNEFENQVSKNIDLLNLKIEDKLKEEIEKIKLEKQQEEERHRKELEEKIKEEFDSFKQGKIDRFNKRLQKFSQLKPIELIKLMESCFENLNAFIRWPHPIFPARTAKEIVYCIDLIAVCLKRFYQKLEQKSRSNFEFIYKNSLERFVSIIQTVNKMLMENSFVDPDLRMNVVEWTEYQEKSWRGVLVSLECSKQINKFCILNETNHNKLRMLPKRKLSLINRKKDNFVN